MARVHDVSERWNRIPVLALVAAAALVVIGLAMGIYSEKLYRDQRTRDAGVQAGIVAASVTAALAFDDARTAQEYVNALRANPDVDAAGIYDENGAFVAGYARKGAPPPPRRADLAAPHIEGRQLTLVAPVAEKGAELGRVYLRTSIDPLGRRLLRFGGVALVAVMAALLLGVLAAAQLAMRRANAELQSRARELGEANHELQFQMEEREKAEEALRQSQKMEAIGRLTGGVAHDFNNLLMVASSGLELMERTDDPKKRLRLKEGVAQALDRGAGLTRQLLAFSRRTALKPAVVDLGQQVAALQVLLDRSLREDITIALKLEPDLWPVEIDPGEFELALLNIAVNARDAMANGGSITITARNRPALAEGELNGDFVELAIADTGGGIPPDILSRVFEPFFTTKQVGQGTGLGLSQVYGFARSSGGEVRIESRPGKGATILLLLPRSSKPLAVPAAAPAAIAAPSGKTRGRILVVEDDDGVALSVRAMLDELGYASRRAASGEQALEMLAANARYDLVFSDMVMPGALNGLDLAHRIQKDRPELPILLTTGFSEAAAAAAAEGLHLLEKPYDMSALARELEATMRRPGARPVGGAGGGEGASA
jgi:signal transduction histidine kinase/ActR/RegA family two-component response regulator